jgi:tRNA-2-methylthio-N6-dimethylallyladenosine synthase
VAFVPIIEGCNKFCTYCIVPYSRGREKSRTAADIVAEIHELRRHGYKEIHLIGQNVNSYRPKTDAGMESFKGATPFCRLLRAAAATGMERIKFTTSFPRDFHPDIVTAIDEHENLCNWIHLPAQSGSDRVCAGDASWPHCERLPGAHRSGSQSATADVDHQ